eukprot:scaffold1663_cov171-Amphora_coffeaeformis.AAC.2
MTTNPPFQQQQNESPVHPSCAPCVKMLREILTSPTPPYNTPRPRKILDALATRFVWRPTSDGLEVQIPSAVTLPQRRWSRLHPPDHVEEQEQQQESLPAASLPVMWQATSAARQAEEPQSTTASTADDTNNPYEWMQIICKPCANQGPEAGARAFVMGPTPLSMVVCTNRLQGTTADSRRAEMEEILTHEFMHVYDVRQMQLDLRDCENLAYSEIRAARQAECHGSWAPQACTRVKAKTATQNLFPTMGGVCIKQVWEKAYKDTRPFGGGPTKTESFSHRGNATSNR